MAAPRTACRRIADIDLVVDLGARLGSAEWLRGLATVSALIAATIWCASGFTPTTMNASRASAPSHHGEQRAVAPVSIAYGGHTGHVPPATPLSAQRPATPGAATLRLTGFVADSIYGTERAAGAPPSVVADYIRAIAQRLDIGELQPIDRYDMVFDSRHERLLYAGLVHDGQSLGLMRWTLDGREQWLDRTGAGERRDGFVMPVTGARLSSGFGMRFHPILGFSRMHQGVDLAAAYGTPIVAATDGMVSFAGWHGGHGNFVQIVHGGGLGTGYGHMSRYVVSPGQSVQAGQLIGYVGSTGLATGPHCHFEVYRNGVAIDPATASFATTERLGGAALARFEATLARLIPSPVRGEGGARREAVGG